jgi:hypothetical protein
MNKLDQDIKKLEQRMRFISSSCRLMPKGTATFTDNIRITLWKQIDNEIAKHWSHRIRKSVVFNASKSVHLFHIR